MPGRKRSFTLSLTKHFAAVESRPVTLGIVGCGAVTQLYYANALDVLEREGVAQVLALCDPDVDSARHVGARFPIATRSADFEEFLRQNIELIIVASPPACHAEQVILALRAGKAVLCEKPLATSLADAQAIVETAEQTGSILAVGLVRRFLPAARSIKHVLASGLLGDLRAFHCFEGGSFRWPVRSRTYFDRQITGGGVLQDIGPHVLDLLSWWLGRPTSISYEDDSMGGVEANCLIRLGYDTFAGDVQLTRDWERPNRYIFQGSKAWLSWYPNDADHVEIGFPGNEFALLASFREIAIDPFRTGRPARNFHQSFVEQIRNVVAAVRGKTATIVSGIDALYSVQFVEYCYRHRKAMVIPWLSEVEHRAAQKLSDG